MKRLFAALIVLALPSAALALEPPVLDDPMICNVDANGGDCVFPFDRDGLVVLPDEIVTGPVSITGGSTVHLKGGHIKLSSASRTTLTISSPDTVFIEGLIIDANNFCDAISIRNQRGIQITITLQNIYALGTAYNIVDGNCHGDLIQNQMAKNDPGGIDFYIENFLGYTGVNPTFGQGFLIQHEGTGTAYSLLRNVFLHRPTQSTKPMIWMSNETQYNNPYYPIDLENVWLDAIGGVQPNTNYTVPVDGGVITFLPETMITGVVTLITQGWPLDEGEFIANVGLDYDRSYFFTDPGPVSATNIANGTTHDSDSGNFDAGAPVEALWDGCVDGTDPCSPGKSGETSFWVIFDLGVDYDLDSARIFGDVEGSWVSDTWTLEYDEVAADGWTAFHTAADASDNDWFAAADLTGIDNVRWIRVTVDASASVQVREFELEGTTSPPVGLSSGVSVDSADAGATYTSAEQTLINELKADLNTLVTDFNDLVTEYTAELDHVHPEPPAHTHDFSDLSPATHSHPTANHTHTAAMTLEVSYNFCLKHNTITFCADLTPPIEPETPTE